MKKLILSFMFLIFGVSQMQGISVPKVSKYDKRITYAVFNTNDIFQIAAANGYVTVVEFSADESIVTVSTGFNEGWELVERGNLLFIKPKAYSTKLIHSPNPEEGNAASEIIVDPYPKLWRTNLIVTTNLNMYVFELILVRYQKIYKLSFTYPNREKASIQELERRLQEQIEQDKLDVSLNRVSTPRNWDFYMKVNKGSEDISPNFAYDDGVFTYLGFDSTKSFPAVFSYEKGKEGILNTHIKKDGDYDVLVVHKVLPQILLRSGDKVVGVFNKGYAKNPIRKTRETSNDNEVERVLLDAKAERQRKMVEETQKALKSIEQRLNNE